MKRKMNVVLITIDSLRADFLGYQNELEDNTPFLDELATKSYVYKNAIVPSLPTFFCFPSVMMGVPPFTYGMYLGIPETKDSKTIAEILKEHGYKTFAFVANNPSLYSAYNYDRGFDYYSDGYEKSSKGYLSLQETLWNLRQKMPEFVLEFLDYVRAVYHFVTKWKLFENGHKLNQKIEKFLDSKGDSPFFLWVHYMDTHLPYLSGLDEYFYINESKVSRLYKKMVFYKEILTSIRRMKIENLDSRKIIKEAYRSSVKYIDQRIQELYRYLTMRYKDTIFIITSDHGEGFMEHGLFHHEPFSLYNELIRVPLLIHHPSNRHVTVSNTVSLLSIPKTVCGLLGIKTRIFQGSNLLGSRFHDVDHITRILYKCRSPQVRLGVLDNRTPILDYGSLWSYTTPEYKYIIEQDQSKAEFYNLKTDPSEQDNIINKKIKQEKQLKKKLFSQMSIF